MIIILIGRSALVIFLIERRGSFGINMIREVGTGILYRGKLGLRSLVGLLLIGSELDGKLVRLVYWSVF